MTPNSPYKVTGDACLEFIDRKIGFGSHLFNLRTYSEGTTDVEMGFGAMKQKDEGLLYAGTPSVQLQTGGAYSTTLFGWNHDDTKRKIGLILDRCEDGGITFAILSTDSFKLHVAYQTIISPQCRQAYTNLSPLSIELKIDTDYPFPSLPTVLSDNVTNYDPSTNTVCVYDQFAGTSPIVAYSYDDLLNLVPTMHEQNIGYNPGYCWQYQGGDMMEGEYQLSTNKNNTVVGGLIRSLTTPTTVADFMLNDPLYFFAGNVYGFITDEIGFEFNRNLPGRFLTEAHLTQWSTDLGHELSETNGVTLPFNLILTENEQQALNYLNTGILPSDAHLYPLDWENFPNYVPGDDDGDDGTDDNTPDDNERDITPNLPVAPTFTPSMLSNYNWYWLTAPQLQAFINWFWNDVGSINDFSDLVEKIEGLYNDLASAVLMVRYYPVDNDATWIGGKESTTSIKLGMIEQSATVDQLKTTVVPSVREIGNVHIPSKYNSFVDLSPYSALSLYLPFHGFVDMDMNLFSGHDIYIKGVYDHLTGTLQYLIYLDNQFLVNSFVVKMAVDIPITLQSKNDRDSAIFNNLTSSVGGLLGAGATLATGNPIGLVVGAQSMSSGVNSAPLNVRGTVGETGAFYAPPQCALILRRPTIAKPSADIWKGNIGQICGKSYTLSNLRGKGYTKVYNPRITFTSNPLQSEIDEIYDYLTEGVIL